MATTLTPGALAEISDLLRTSRRKIAEIYREHSHGLSAEEIANGRGDKDPRKVLDALSALRVIFGRDSLPKRGEGRQLAIAEAQYWVNADVLLSDELRSHFNKILYVAKRTNTRNVDSYTPPEPVLENLPIRKKRGKFADGRQPGVYILTRKSYAENPLEDGSLLVKIGYSETVWERVENAQTWDPEPIALLRVYLTERPKEIEAKFHIVLDTLNLRHDGGGGSEWFTAKLELLDAIAATLSLRDCAADLQGTDTIELWEGFKN